MRGGASLKPKLDEFELLDCAAELEGERRTNMLNIAYTRAREVRSKRGWYGLDRWRAFFLKYRDIRYGVINDRRTRITTRC